MGMGHLATADQSKQHAIRDLYALIYTPKPFGFAPEHTGLLTQGYTPANLGGLGRMGRRPYRGGREAGCLVLRKRPRNAGPNPGESPLYPDRSRR